MCDGELIPLSKALVVPFNTSKVNAAMTSACLATLRARTKAVSMKHKVYPLINTCIVIPGGNSRINDGSSSFS